MRLITLLLVFTISIPKLFAQDSSFHLKDYKYRTAGYKALEISFGLNGSLLEAENNNLEQESKGISLAPAAISYFYTKSTDKRINVTTFFTVHGLSTSKSKNDVNTSKFNNYNSITSLVRNDKIYNKANKYFEIGNALSSEILNHYGANTSSKNRRNNVNIVNTLILGIGKGRIEAVQDAQMALYILNDLKEQGLIKDTDAATEYQFAQLVTDINNRRIFDNRRRRIYELQKIDSFIKTQELTSETNINHFSIINDNWALAFNPQRFSGTNFYLRLSPSAGFMKQKRSNDYNTIFNKTNKEEKFIALSPQVGFEKYVPINLKWQKNLGANFSVGRNWSENNYKEEMNSGFLENEFYQQASFATINSFYAVEFYPNNRTLLNAAINLSATYFDFKNGNITEQFTGLASLNFNTNYFISYRTRLLANFNLNYISNSAEDINSIKTNSQALNSNFSIAFSHIIF